MITLFRRRGRKVHAACWAYDGSRQVAAGQRKLSRGNTFVVAAIVVTPPFLDRPIALPVLARLWRPGGPTKTAQALDLISLIARARRDRVIHVVADGAYVCKTLRRLPGPEYAQCAPGGVHSGSSVGPEGRRPRDSGAQDRGERRSVAQRLAERCRVTIEHPRTW